MNTPLVTVYITTHNRKNSLNKAIDSVLNQTYSNLEIIVSDDGSQDGTREFMVKKSNSDSRIKYIRSDTPRGANAARNKALHSAKGVFITGLDDDDTFTSSRIENFVNEWKDEISFLCDNFYNLFPDRTKKNYSSRKVKIKLDQLLLNNIASNQIFTKTERLLEVGGFDESLKRLQDWECWIRMCGRYGNAFRLNKMTYLMKHEDINRVSKSQSFFASRKILVENNRELYNKYPDWFVSNYLLSKNYNIFDLLRFSNIPMLKLMVLSLCGKYEN